MEMQDTFCVNKYGRVNCVQIVFFLYIILYNFINGGRESREICNPLDNRFF